MNANELAAIAADTEGKLVKVYMTDGTDQVVVSQGRVTTKGFVAKVSDEDSGVFYIARTKIDKIGPHDEAPMDRLAHDGMTTRDLAAIVGTDPKTLRVALRALGLGVGKGRKYNLPADALVRVKAHLGG